MIAFHISPDMDNAVTVVVVRGHIAERSDGTFRPVGHEVIVALLKLYGSLVHEKSNLSPSSIFSFTSLNLLLTDAFGNMTPDPMKAIPADLKAFQDCLEEITDDSQPYEVAMEDNVSKDYSAKRMCDILGHISKRLASLIAQRGKTVNRVTVLEQLLDASAIYKLGEYTTEMLVSRKLVLWAAATTLLGFLHGEQKRRALTVNHTPEWIPLLW
ncbi:hypothetical protein IV203_027550 [Nitzschia inconspicua]|uniref:Uncharacterized protein n=1 Tax=Nitzschia inconspicua TaxID=303405 RepID=A0A9K3LXA2_9STRA|nr:hypothetical protein IV203_027550 [Nitzschia inconspicua]